MFVEMPPKKRPFLLAVTRGEKVVWFDITCPWDALSRHTLRWYFTSDHYLVRSVDDYAEWEAFPCWCHFEILF